MARTTLDLIQEMLRGKAVLNAPMSELTTVRVGGPADILIYPADREDLARLMPVLSDRAIPYLVLGNGSNLIVRDGGIRGAVLCLREGFSTLARLDRGEKGPAIRAAAGVNLQGFVRWTVDEGIGGFEALCGIPGTVGGALAMNAGAWGHEIGERVVELEVMDPSGAVLIRKRDTLRFGYRSLELSPGWIILGAVLQGEASAPQELKARVTEYFNRRKATQPLSMPSAGSVFKNPPGRSAGRLIEECGLKGVRVGDAEVSSVHANFIVNAGKATAGQVVSLISMMQERVFVKNGVKLEPEVRIVGDWEKDKLRIRG